MHSIVVSNKHGMQATEARLQSGTALGQDCNNMLMQEKTAALEKLDQHVASAKRVGTERLEKAKEAASKTLAETVAAAKKKGAERLEKEKASALETLKDNVAAAEKKGAERLEQEKAAAIDKLDQYVANVKRAGAEGLKKEKEAASAAAKRLRERLPLMRRRVLKGWSWRRQQRRKSWSMCRR